jgi:hypothetical protein
MNPKIPSARMPMAETFVMVSNSFLVGFFNTCHTLSHLMKKDFADVVSFMIKERGRGF